MFASSFRKDAAGITDRNREDKNSRVALGHAEYLALAQATAWNRSDRKTWLRQATWRWRAVRAHGGSQSPCAAIRSSTRFQI